MPIGSSQEVAEEYLRSQGIPYTFGNPIHPYFRKPITFGKNLGDGFLHGMASGGFAINQEGKVAEIAFSVYMHK